MAACEVRRLVRRPNNFSDATLTQENKILRSIRTEIDIGNYLCLVAINVQRLRAVLFLQVNRFEIVEISFVQVDGVVLKYRVFARLDHAFHLRQVSFILLLLLPVASSLLLVQTVDILWPTTFNMCDAYVTERRIVGGDKCTRDRQAVLNFRFNGRHDFELFLALSFGIWN